MLHPPALIQHTTSVQGLHLYVCMCVYECVGLTSLAFPLAPACTRHMFECWFSLTHMHFLSLLFLPSPVISDINNSLHTISTPKTASL